MTAQQIVDALEDGTLVIPADYREILQALAAVVNGSADAGYVSIVDGLEAGTIVVPPDYRDIFQAIAAVVNGSADSAYTDIVDGLEAGTIIMPPDYSIILTSISNILNSAAPASDLSFVADGTNFTGFGLTAPVGVDNISVNWGDGNTELFSGSGVMDTLAHTYGDGDHYTVAVTVTGATEFVVDGDDGFGSEDSLISTGTMPTTLTLFDVGYNAGLSSIDTTNLTSCTSFYCRACTSLETLDTTSLTSVISFNCRDCTSLETLDTTSLTSVTLFNCSSCTSLATLDTTGLTSCTDFICNNCILDVTNVNNALVNLDTFGLLNGSADLSGQTPAAAPTGAGATAATNLAGKGWLVTTD